MGIVLNKPKATTVTRTKNTNPIGNSLADKINAATKAGREAQRKKAASRKAESSQEQARRIEENKDLISQIKAKNAETPPVDQPKEKTPDAGRSTDSQTNKGLPAGGSTPNNANFSSIKGTQEYVPPPATTPKKEVKVNTNNLVYAPAPKLKERFPNPIERASAYLEIESERLLQKKDSETKKGELLGLGFAKGIVDTASIISQPIKTAKGAIQAVTNPFETGAAIGNQLKRNPVGFAGEITGGIVASKGIASATKSLSIVKTGVPTPTGKLASKIKKIKANIADQPTGTRTVRVTEKGVTGDKFVPEYAPSSDVISQQQIDAGVPAIYALERVPGGKTLRQTQFGIRAKDPITIALEKQAQKILSENIAIDDFQIRASQDPLQTKLAAVRLEGVKTESGKTVSAIAPRSQVIAAAERKLPAKGYQYNLEDFQLQTVKEDIKGSISDLRNRQSFLLSNRKGSITPSLERVRESFTNPNKKGQINKPKGSLFDANTKTSTKPTIKIKKNRVVPSAIPKTDVYAPEFLEKQKPLTDTALSKKVKTSTSQDTIQPVKISSSQKSSQERLLKRALSFGNTYAYESITDIPPNNKKPPSSPRSPKSGIPASYYSITRKKVPVKSQDRSPYEKKLSSKKDKKLKEDFSYRPSISGVLLGVRASSKDRRSYGFSGLEVRGF